MWEAGLVEEVRTLAAAGLREGRTASRGLGYAQVLRMLGGAADPEQTRKDVVAATRRYVRRQESWFRRDRGVRWLDYDSSGLLRSAAAAVAAAGEGSPFTPSPAGTSPGPSSPPGTSARPE